jgi:hypothetical protein
MVPNYGVNDGLMTAKIVFSLAVKSVGSPGQVALPWLERRCKTKERHQLGNKLDSSVSFVFKRRKLARSVGLCI